MSQIISGGVHYFRVHPEQWADRLHKARLMGVNCVDAYVPWNLHSPSRGEFLVDGGLDLPRFLELAAAEDLQVLLRPGPYICAELDAGGLPAWLLGLDGVVLRSLDPAFMEAVSEYFDALLKHVLPALATRGGPIVAVQVENEYGAYGSDPAYLERIAAMLRDGGVDVPLFTCDQPGDLARGGLPGIRRTVNFRNHAAAKLARLREFESDPLMVSEFWVGWFDRWGGVHSRRSASDAAAELDVILSAGADVNLYMVHGGTNFGFSNGANDKGTYRATITSYDYDSPLDEAGDPTAKYAAFREVISRYAPVPSDPIPGPSPKLGPLTVALTEHASLLDQIDALGSAVSADRPLSMEELGQSFGFVHYSARLSSAGPALLNIDSIRDRAQVFVDGQPVGVLERENHDHALAFQSPRPDARLTVLVENLGRVNYGPGLRDLKGLFGAVTVNDASLPLWQSTPLPLDDLSALTFSAESPVGPAFHRGTFDIAEPADTFLALPGWTKGVAWINGFNLGRYWSRGPQRTLYVPGPVLRRGRNEIVVLELHASSTPEVELRPAPDLGPTEE